MADVTNEEILAEMKSGSLLNKARAAFSDAWAELDQAGMQRVKPTIFDIRQMEFDAVKRIAKVLGVEL